jgi:hypothetical protein
MPSTSPRNVKDNPFRLVITLILATVAATSVWGFAYILNDDTGLPIKWGTANFPFRVMLGTRNGIDQNTTFQSAASAWNAVLGNTQFQLTFATGTAGERNGQNEAVFAADVFGEAFDENVLAVTTTFLRGNERIQADIVFNSARNWGSYNGPTQSGLTDLRRVAIHELGHALGLDHPDEAGQNFAPPVPIMNSRITGNDALTQDDITGVQNLYGPPGVPANDNFANAFEITLANNAAAVTGYTTNATKQAGEPNHASNSGGHSVWWRWMAPVAGPVTLDTRGSYADTTLGVYTGSTVNALTLIASDDDIQDSVIQASELTFNAVAGTTYHIAIDGFDGDSAGVTLNFRFTPTGPAVPIITSQPTSATVTAGNTASFAVTATNAVSYQWVFNGNSIGGATSSSLSIPNAQAANAGNYSVTVTNGNGSVNSNTVTLTVNAAPAPVPTPPPSSGGGGGGGGAPSAWFYGMLGLLAMARYARRR